MSSNRILDPGDEVILLNPYFPEYRFYVFYVKNHAGSFVSVETDECFRPNPNVRRISEAITPRTKAPIVNSPNNPTGAVYDAGVLRALDSLILEPILVISDGPYRPLVYDGREPPETLRIIRGSVLAWSWSKATAIAGERIGFPAIPPHLAEAAALRNACIFAMKILGSIHATALWQLVVAHAPDATIGVAHFK